MNPSEKTALQLRTEAATLLDQATTADTKQILATISVRAKKTLADIADAEHRQRLSAYADYQSALKYLNDCNDYIIQNYEPITDQNDKIIGGFKWLDTDRTCALTYQSFQAGNTLTSRNNQFLITDFNADYYGSTMALLPLNSKAFIIGTPHTPYSGLNCHFNPSKKKITLPLTSKLLPSTAIELSGKTYTLFAQFPSATFNSYELREV